MGWILDFANTTNKASATTWNLSSLWVLRQVLALHPIPQTLLYTNHHNLNKGDTLAWGMKQGYNFGGATADLTFTSTSFTGTFIAPGYKAA